jgi:hypothetical protein
VTAVEEFAATKNRSLLERRRPHRSTNEQEFIVAISRSPALTT